MFKIEYQSFIWNLTKYFVLTYTLK